MSSLEVAPHTGGMAIPTAHDSPQQFLDRVGRPDFPCVRANSPAAPEGLDIFDALGRNVARLFDGRLSAGQHQIHWDGRSAGGAPVPAGLYFLSIEEEGQPRITARILRK